MGSDAVKVYHQNSEEFVSNNKSSLSSGSACPMNWGMNKRG
jgi:hypothetical protein